MAPILSAELAYVRRASPLIEEALRVLSDSAVEKALASEPSPRWRANYLLARGRLHALGVRHREYEMLVGAMLNGKVVWPATTDLNFASTETLLSGDEGRKRVAEARRWLDLCIAGHPNTPWAALASHEKNACGLTLQQRVTLPGNGPPPRGWSRSTTTIGRSAEIQVESRSGAVV